MLNQFSRTELILGQRALATLATKRVAVFGVGGVGGNVVEALARSQIGEIDLIDDDLVCLTNINRQILATFDTVGKAKVDVAEERIHSISRKIVVHKHRCFYLPDDHGDIDFSKFDYVVDALDTVSAKLDIICEAKKRGIPVISALGCGNRVDPTKLKICDIYQTEGDPLARVVRRELRKRGVKDLKVVYSTELPIRPREEDTANSCLYHCVCPPGTKRKCTDRRDIPGSTAFVPPVAGILIAYAVCMDLTSWNRDNRGPVSEETLEAVEQEKQSL